MWLAWKAGCQRCQAKLRFGLFMLSHILQNVRPAEIYSPGLTACLMGMILLSLNQKDKGNWNPPFQVREDFPVASHKQSVPLYLATHLLSFSFSQLSMLLTSSCRTSSGKYLLRISSGFCKRGPLSLCHFSWTCLLRNTSCLTAEIKKQPIPLFRNQP